MKTLRLKVSEFADVYAGGTPPTGNPDYWDGDVAWVTPKDLSAHAGVYIGRGDRCITEQGLRRSSACLLATDTVILSTRAPVGYVAIASSPLATNQGCKNLRCKDGVAHPLYVYYLLKNSTSILESHATGSTYKELSASRLKNITFSLPENIADQITIASILSSYDDLIENIRRRIQLLEQAARTLYEEWFVRLRFPGHEGMIATNGVPKRWKRTPFSELASIIMGQSPKSIHYNDEGLGLPFHQGVTNFGQRFPSHRIYCTATNRIALPGDILFSVRAPVGRINVTLDRIVIGRGIAAVRSNRGQQNFLFYALKNRFFKEDLIGGGTIFSAVAKKDLHRVELVQPEDEIVSLFTEFVAPIDGQLASLQRTIGKLRQARDTILPRLMNGEIECP